MHRIVVIGASAGGLNAVSAILSGLRFGYPIPIILVQHRSRGESQLLENILQTRCPMRVKQADEKEIIREGIVYVAPPGYHLLIERDRRFSLSADGPVKHSIPSIDVTFQTAAEVFRDKVTGIVLTGCSDDGADGIKAIKRFNGVTLAQDPGDAKYSLMPQAAIATKMVDHVLSLAQIRTYLAQADENHEKR